MFLASAYFFAQSYEVNLRLFLWLKWKLWFSRDCFFVSTSQKDRNFVPEIMRVWLNICNLLEVRSPARSWPISACARDPRPLTSGPVTSCVLRHSSSNEKALLHALVLKQFCSLKRTDMKRRKWFSVRGQIFLMSRLFLTLRSNQFGLFFRSVCECQRALLKEKQIHMRACKHCAWFQERNSFMETQILLRVNSLANPSVICDHYGDLPCEAVSHRPIIPTCINPMIVVHRGFGKAGFSVQSDAIDFCCTSVYISMAVENIFKSFPEKLALNVVSCLQWEHRGNFQCPCLCFCLSFYCLRFENWKQIYCHLFHTGRLCAMQIAQRLNPKTTLVTQETNPNCLSFDMWVNFICARESFEAQMKTLWGCLVDTLGQSEGFMTILVRSRSKVNERVSGSRLSKIDKFLLWQRTNSQRRQFFLATLLCKQAT